MQVNKEKWQELLHKSGKVQAAVGREVWPYLNEPAQKISNIACGRDRILPKDIARLTNALGCTPDDILECFSYLKEEK